jgi:hypothetical protein
MEESGMRNVLGSAVLVVMGLAVTTAGVIAVLYG